MEWLLKAPVLFFSVVFHEFSHGYAAYRRGDDTAYLSGRLTLNPLAHIDLFGTIILPVMCQLSGLPMFGWAKPVPVNPYRLRDMRKDMMMVALNGPLSNLALALLFAIFLKLALVAQAHTGGAFAGVMAKAMAFGVMINLTLAFFNLIPVLPLDGSQIVSGLLPRKWLKIYERHAPYGIWIIIGLTVTGLIRYLLLPPIYISIYLISLVGLNG